ncbi:hypothetical protein FSP39_022008 [Pinctada imbricata]|uniref:Uncharacterized protein n=1 Tax=Pinctada imbricata TaxID=66713 RepID=A0AA88XNF2_PINIB|nr:hypothetical protein FSP39_022008 [Pinctada imbricata]
MAFNTTYHRLLDNNIRHIYSGLPTDLRFRQPGFRQKLNPASRCVELQRRPPDRFERKFLQYDEKYDINIPRAPALRTVSRAEADAIVTRVSRPTTSSKLRRDTCSREETRQQKDSCVLCTYHALPRPVSRKELRDITNRLMTPTISANIRNRTRTRRDFVITDVTESCARVASTPSMRYRYLRVDSADSDTYSSDFEADD